MEAETMECPFCCEPIPARAVRCRFCRSRVKGVSREDWHRGYPDRKVAGVCAALAHNLQLPVVLVRVAMVVLLLFHGLGLWAYALLWALLPAGPGVDSAAERALAWLRSALRWGPEPDTRPDGRP